MSLPAHMPLPPSWWVMSLNDYEPSARFEDSSVNSAPPSQKESKVDIVARWLTIAAMMLKAFREVKETQRKS
jgi:hypothetical protein